jgi:hypothetical protein
MYTLPPSPSARQNNFKRISYNVPPLGIRWKTIENNSQWPWILKFLNFHLTIFNMFLLLFQACCLVKDIRDFIILLLASLIMFTNVIKTIKTLKFCL